MYQKILFLTLTLLYLLSLSCNKDDHFVEPELQPYIDRFFEEASSRGQSLPTKNVQAFLLPQVEEAGVRVCGLGYAPIFGDKIRRIDIDQLCWKFASEMEREILVFHELGHALLDRTHNDWKLPNGRNRSIMFRGDNCDIYASYSDCQQELRSYYVDELFSEGITVPYWSKRQSINRSYFTENFDLKGVRWESNLETNNVQIQLDSISFNSAPYSIQLNQTSSEEGQYWQRKITLSPIKTCSNITLSVMVKTENLGDGVLEILLSYPSFDENNNPTATCTHAFSIRETTRSKGAFQNFEFGMFCVPGGVKEMDIRLVLKAEGAAAVNIDDFNMRLWD